MGFSQNLVSCADLFRYSEVPGENHWFDTVFSDAQYFLDDLIDASATAPRLESLSFTLRTANPDESGSKFGFKILELDLPGRFARIDVQVVEGHTLHAILTTKNVRAISFDSSVFNSTTGMQITSIRINDATFPVSGVSPTLLSMTSNSSAFQIVQQVQPRRYGPLISILTTPTPLRLIYGSAGLPSETEHLRSIAERIARDLYVAARIDCIISSDVESADFGSENLVLIGSASTNSVLRAMAVDWTLPGELMRRTDWESAGLTLANSVRFVSADAFAIHEQVFQKEGTGA